MFIVFNVFILYLFCCVFVGSTPSHNNQNRRNRGGRRGPQGREVPKEDFDFQTALDGFDKDALDEEFQNKLKIGK